MVENINKLPEPEDFEHPSLLKKNKNRAQTAEKSKLGDKSGRNSALNKSVSKNNISKMSNKFDSPSKTSLNLGKQNSSMEKRTPSKLLLTN